MAELDKYPVPLYDPMHPYHWEYDNLPLKALIARDIAINSEVEYVSAIIRDCNGTQGTLSNRLNQSINPDGSLKYISVDEALHGIGNHTDSSRTLTQDEIDAFASLGYIVTNPVPFVRMLNAERDKLSLIAEDATNMTIQVETPSTIVLFEQGPVTFSNSTTVTWEVSGGNTIKAHLGFPTESIHRHYYDIDPLTTDFKNYEVTSVDTPFVEGTLRVYINGFRLSETTDIYVPGALVTDEWTLNSFTSTPEDGTFVLANAVTSEDVVRIDFDVSLT